MNRQYTIHPGAIRDMNAIWDFIAEDDVSAANRILDEIFQAIQKISSFPHAGHKRPNLSTRPVLFWNVRELLIAYAPDLDPPMVISVLDGRRDPAKLRSILRSRI